MHEDYFEITEFRWVVQKRIFMKVILILFLVTFFIRVESQNNNLSGRWTDKTACLIPAGKWESGLFQSFRFGINDRMEISTNALLIPVLPNAAIRIGWRSDKKLLLTSEHSVNFPSVLLNVLSFKGTGGLISPQFSFPFIMTFYNSLLATMEIGSSSLLTADAGFAIALRKYKPDYQSSIDIPFIYQRMAHYYDGASLRAGISFKGTIFKNLYFEEGTRIFLITRNSDNFFIENSGSVLWASKGSLRIKGGYLLSWGRYPFGDHLQLWPAFDLIFGSRIKTKDKTRGR